MFSKPARDQRMPGALLSLFSTRFDYATAKLPIGKWADSKSRYCMRS